ncbi:MAG TPA: hypothetical protein VFY29_15055 [Terriglobia bacterium]|nr:hypothetical protein [Terriglobia bacterium]
MPRCLHIYESGVQCVDESVPDGDFCGDHDVRSGGFDHLEEDAWRRVFRRFVAFLLLVLFLIPLLYSLKSLYWGPPQSPVEAR